MPDAGPQHSFFVVPPVVPATRPAEASPDDEERLGTNGGATEDGSRVFGSTIALYYPSHAESSGTIRWSLETGTTQITDSSFYACFAFDGSSAIGVQHEPMSHQFMGFFHWNETQGMTPIQVEVGAGFPVHTGGGGYSCARNNDIFLHNVHNSGLDTVRALTWQATQHSGKLVELQPEGVTIAQSRGELSRDGSSIGFNFWDVDGVLRPFHWTRQSGFEELQPPPGQSCEITLISDKGGVMAGICRTNDSSPRAFRWSTADHAVTLLSETDTAVLRMSADGELLAGADAYPTGNPFYDSLTIWRGSSTVLDTTRKREVSVIGFSDDGTLFLNEFEDGPASLTRALRWTESVGLEWLPWPEGQRWVEVQAYSSDGQVAVGVSVIEQEAARTYEAVLWDAQGVRTISRELVDAGIDLQGVQLLLAARVWNTSPLRIQGIGEIPPPQGRPVPQTWFAELPLRQ